MAKKGIATVEHVGVVMDNLDGARQLFHEKLRLPIAEMSGPDGEAFAVKAGDTVIRVAAIDSADAQRGRRGVSHVAFKVPSLAALDAPFAEGGVRKLDGVNTGAGGRKAVWTDPATTIGIPLQFVEESAKLDFKPAQGKPMVERVDHLGIACHDGRRAHEIFVDSFGWPLESTQTDSEFLIPVEVTSNDRHGATSHTRPPIAAVGSGLIALFVTVGDFDFEIMQPLGAAKLSAPLGSIPGSVGQDQGAIARALEKRGEGLLHIGFKTLDMQHAIDTVTSQGIRMIDPVARPGGRNSRIAYMDRRSTEGILLHFVGRTPLD